MSVGAEHGGDYRDAKHGAEPYKHIAAAFYLLAGAFDDDPFTILAWRGQEREDLLANLHAVRSDGPPAADRADRADPPLADCLESYFTVQGEIPLTSPPATASGSLLEQLPPVNVTVQGQALTGLLQPACLAFSRLGADRAGDPPTVADRDALVLRPGPDIRAALTAGHGPPGPAPLPPARPAGVLDERRELPAERTGVPLLRSISYSAPPSPNRTVSSAGPPSMSFSSATGYLLCHPCLPYAAIG